MVQNMQKRTFLAIIAILAVVVISALTFNHKGYEKKQLYVFLPSASNPFWIEVRKGVEAAAKDYSKKFDVRILTAGDMDAANQVEQLQTVLERGKVAAIVLGVANNRAPAPIIAQYNAQNIPVVMIDTDLDKTAAKESGAKWNAFIGSDNRFGGKLAATTMIKALATVTEPKVLLIKGSYVHQSAIDRAEGFVEGAGGQLQVIEREGEWSRQRAMELTAGVMARDKVDGIFASNDDMALGAIAALENAGIPKDKRPIVIGFDATSAGKQAISQGDMYASIGQQAGEMGRAGATSAMKLAQGETLKENKILIPVSVVSKENIR
ncbi:sugar ABC transporter substrate-binding protein [Kordiimonas marina]|uniref:sugar ABC transporter substrate-binding protein n=1 Tax=Kordiimonas marina TaxID=2872312 RepID=UPI001FF40270|nr:sugar ABC transporter substrate-binding protein [Kordiimonas marina]